MIGASSVPVVVALFCFISNSVSYPALRPVLSRPFRPQTLYASEISPAAASTGNRTEIGTAEDPWPRVSWTAAAQGTVVVKDNKRTVEQYMALPASEYSVLSASQIQRIGDSEFVCTLPTMNFFGTKITPTLYVDVLVYPEDAKAEIIVSRAETSGSEMAAKVNGTFSINAVNTVTAGVDDKGRKTLSSRTNLKIDALVPSNKLPIRVIQSGGNFLMQSTLNVIVPTFVRVLRADFNRWAAGVDERAPVEGAKLG